MNAYRTCLRTAFLVSTLALGACGGEDEIDWSDGHGDGCEPGAVRACYSGPDGTLDVGICSAGEQTCEPSGEGWGPCSGEVLPELEDCGTAEDEDCDGQTPSCPGDEHVDLRADVDRDGTVDLTGDSDQEGEDGWDGERGAIFLPNIDDDGTDGVDPVCARSGSDEELAACHDATNDVVDGANDLLDLARILSVPWPEAPDEAVGTVLVSSPGSGFVRLFASDGSSLQPFDPASDRLSAAELRAGVELAIEAVDVVRDANIWDGFVDLSLRVDLGPDPGREPFGIDTVRLRAAPLLFRHHLHPIDRVYATVYDDYAPSEAFIADLEAAMGAAAVPQPLYGFDWNVVGSDKWTQDHFETAYLSMPSTGGQQQVIHVNLRSANYDGDLRYAGRLVYTALRGPDVAGLTQYDPDDPSHGSGRGTLNSCGNFETIPPYSHGGQSWPLGRVLRGGSPDSGIAPDQSLDRMVDAQGVQDIVRIDTWWLDVAHVDETLSFVKTSSPRGWAMLVADPALARSMLEEHCDVDDPGPDCSVVMFEDLWWWTSPAEISIYDVLTDTDLMNDNAWAAASIDDQLEVMTAETGITEPEMVPVPSLFEQVSMGLVAYVPGMVNGIYLADGHFGPPDPHGPEIGGEDIFKAKLEEALEPHGVSAQWIEDWTMYHLGMGEVHCGTNATRHIPAGDGWWESGL